MGQDQSQNICWAQSCVALSTNHWPRTDRQTDILWTKLTLKALTYINVDLLEVVSRYYNAIHNFEWVKITHIICDVPHRPRPMSEL